MADLGSLRVSLEANTAKLESDLGKAASIADARAKDIARSFSVVQKAIADQKGISANVLAPYLQQLDQATSKQKEAGHAMEEFSFKTAGAKRELLVLAHELSQGNFSRFGGSLLVLGERTGAASLLFSKAALAAGGLATAVIALGVAIAEGANEATQYAKALTLTGNYLGQTTDQLAAMAQQIAKTTGTQGQAAAALADLANTGKIASGSLTDVGAAVVSMNRVLGTEVDKAVEIFSRLAEEPAKASLKLNETTHYLTLSTYERIRALEEQGQKEEAAALAQTTYASAINTRLASVEAQAGVLTKAWRALAHDAKDAWDMMQGLGRPKSTGELLSDAQQALAAKQARGPLNSLTDDAYAKGVAKLQAQVTDLTKKGLREQENAYAEGEKVRAESAKIAASDRLSTLTKEVQTNADKRKKAIADLNNDFKTLGKATSGPEYDKLVENINEKFKDPKGAKEKAFTDDAGTRFLETLRQTEASLAAQLVGEDKLTDAQREQVKFQQLLIDLKGKGMLTEEQKSLVANQDAIKAQLAKNVAISQEIEYEKEIKKIVDQSAASSKEFARQIDAVNISIASAQQSRTEQQDRTLSSFGLGSRAIAEVEAQKAIRKEFETYKRQLTKEAASKDQLGSDEYKDEVARIQAALNDSLAAQQAYFDALKSKQADWKNGATTALQNYSDAVDNLAEQTNHALTNGFTGAENALTSFVTTGKADFKSLANSIIADLARIAIQQTITGPLAKGLQGALGGLISGGSGSYTMGSFSGLSADTLALGGYASGGDPPVGKVSLVGENGPELFVPRQAGTIIPNGGGSSGGVNGGGDTYNYSFTVGDVATVSMVREAIAGSERRIGGVAARSQKYGGALA